MGRSVVYKYIQHVKGNGMVLNKRIIMTFVCLFALILYFPSTIFQLNRDGSSLVEPVLS